MGECECRSGNCRMVMSTTKTTLKMSDPFGTDRLIARFELASARSFTSLQETAVVAELLSTFHEPATDLMAVIDVAARDPHADLARLAHHADSGGRRRQSQRRPRIRIPIANHNSIIKAVARSQDFQVVVEMPAAKSLVGSRKSNSIAPSSNRDAGQSTIKLPRMLE